MALSCPLRTTHGVPLDLNSALFPYIINPLLTKLVRSTWLDIGVVSFFVIMDLDSILGHKHAKKDLVNIQL